MLLLHQGSQIDFLRLPRPRGERRTDEAKRGARRSQNQFTPLGDGVDKLIFEAVAGEVINYKNE